jgi:transcriptional regulator with XRE-family HTH domain
MAKVGSAEDLKVAVSFLRSLRGWNQKELAEASGVDRALISQYEQGKKVPSQRTLEKLVAAVGIPFTLFEDILPFIRLVRSLLAGDIPDEEAVLAAGPLALSINDVVHTAMAEALAGLSLLTQPERDPAAESARIQAEEQWRRLSRRPAREQQLLMEGAREFQTWAMCERLCVESEEAAAHDPGRALELAELALKVAHLVPGSEGSRSRLQGYVWAFIGNARRAAGDRSAASEAFAQARRLWTAGSPGDEGPLAEMHVLYLTGPLDEE